MSIHFVIVYNAFTGGKISFSQESMHMRILIGLLLCSVAVVAYAEEVSTKRRYELGSLTAKDFQAKPPEEGGAKALTKTEVHYAYKYNYQQGTTAISLQLSQIEIIAFIRTDLSWNKRPQEMWLLDHEQGHFDNAYIIALQCQLEFETRIQKDNKVFTFAAASQNEAVQKLEEELKIVMQSFFDKLKVQDQKYDETTSHGIEEKEQLEWRSQQRTQIRELQKKLTEFSTPKKAEK
jgi:hypothetical protein